MYTIRFQRTTALTGIAAAVLVAIAAWPAVAGHGLLMKEHPLRGDFPTASDTTRSKSAEDVAAADPRPVARERDEPGGWLRGDFPMAAESRTEQASPDPATAGSKAVVTRGIGETWSCTVQTASAQDAGTGPTQAVMRVIHLPQ
jgi:hypothetical protein